MLNKDLRALARTDNVSDLPLFRALGDIPTVTAPPDLVRVARRRMEQRRMGSYEEANWDRLSPIYREAHNRLRAARGQAPIPPPEVDRYVPPPPAIRPFDPNDREAIAAARQFGGTPIMGPRGSEGEVIPERFRKVFG